MTSATATVQNVAPISRATPVRAEIQALRALAVLGVLLFHLWPQRLQGGYVGVDVFFVVSGFLITDHLVRDHEQHGRVLLARFWGRRARRLLPASLLVLTVTAIAVYAWIPLSRWAQIGWELLASALYVENWALAAQSVDYMATSNVASPVQHFWTLGVEEQFYLIWPLLLMAGAAIAVRGKRDAVAGIAVAVGLATAGSLAFSIVYTALVPTIAYYSTFTRAWEFGAGALLALLLRRRPEPLPGTWAVVASWTGWAMIIAAMVLYTATTPFPSFTAALPVLGTILVIAAGTPDRRPAPTRLIGVRPVQFVGDVSYGVYLWHWPLIVLLPFLTLSPLTTWQKALIAAASIALGWASKRFVEDPIRTRSWFAHGRARRSLWGAATGMALVSALALPLALSTVPPAPRAPSALPSCWGAGSLADPACDGPLARPLEAPAESFAGDLPAQDVRECEITVELAAYRRCDRVTADPAAPHVALVGDSHATRWVEAFDRAARSSDWSLSTYLVSGCPLVSSEPIGGVWGYDPVGAELCTRPTGALLDELAADPTLTDVVLTNRTRLYLSDDTADHPLTADAVAASIRRLQDAGKNVVVLKDHPEVRGIPEQGGGSGPDCLALADAHRCVLTREEASFEDPMAAAAAQTGAAVIDLTDSFCDATTCYWQIGGLSVYTDDNHLSRSFAASLARPLGDALAPLLSR